MRALCCLLHFSFSFVITIIFSYFFFFFLLFLFLFCFSFVFSAIFDDFCRFSKKINEFHYFFIDFHRFLSIWDKGPNISANCLHSPQSKTLTKGPPRERGEKKVHTKVPILARHISRQRGDLFVHPTRIFPRQQCQFWTQNRRPAAVKALT